MIKGKFITKPLVCGFFISMIPMYLYVVGLNPIGNVLTHLYSAPSKISGMNDTMYIRLGKAKLLVEIADTPNKRSVGLMYRDKLDFDKGMLFVFPEEDYLSFWMKNTNIPLSIGYFNKDGVLLEIYDMLPNQIHTSYPSLTKAIYALEVNKGWFQENKIKEGAVLIFEKSILGR